MVKKSKKQITINNKYGENIFINLSKVANFDQNQTTKDRKNMKAFACKKETIKLTDEHIINKNKSQI